MMTSHAATTSLPITETAAPQRFAWLAKACTILVVAQLAASGAMMILHPAGVLAMLRHLGYPDYFAAILGVAKVLGAAAIAIPRFATATEWAYAGATFDVVAASASHVAVGDPAAEALEPLVALALIAAAYAAFRARVGRPIGLHLTKETT